jgi:hypothetical protein
VLPYDLLMRRNASDSVLARLATRGKGRPTFAAVEYDDVLQMSRMATSRVLAIDYTGNRPPTTKKFDIEKGEDQKDR